jgi:hypothetical protein
VRQEKWQHRHTLLRRGLTPWTMDTKMKKTF